MKCWMRRGRRQFYFISQLRKRRGSWGEGMAYFSSSPRSCNYDIFFASFPFFVGEEREGRRNKRRRGRRWWQQMTPQEKERRLVAIKVCLWASLGIFKRETMVGRREEERPTWKLYNTADSFKTFLKPQSFVLSPFLSRKKRYFLLRMHFFRSAVDFFLSPPFAGNHGERQENSAALPRINCGLKKRKGSYSPTPQFLYLFRSEQQKVQFFSRKQGRHKLAEKKRNKILHLPLQLVSRTTAPQKSETRISRIIDFF